MLPAVLKNILAESSASDDENKRPHKRLKSDTTIPTSQLRAEEAHKFEEFMNTVDLSVGYGPGKGLWALVKKAKNSMWDPRDCNLECLELMAPEKIKQQCMKAVACNMTAIASIIDANGKLCNKITNPQIKTFFCLFHATLTTHLEFMDSLYSRYVTDSSERLKIINSLKENVVVKETLDRIRNIETDESLQRCLYKLLLTVKTSYSSFDLMAMSAKQVTGFQKGCTHIKYDLATFEKYVCKLYRLLMTSLSLSEALTLKDEAIKIQIRLLKGCFPDLFRRHEADIKKVITSGAKDVLEDCHGEMEQEDDADNQLAELLNEDHENISPLEDNNVANQRGAAGNPTRRKDAFSPQQLCILAYEFDDSGETSTCPPKYLATLIDADEVKVSKWWHRERHKRGHTPHNPRGRSDRSRRLEGP